MKKKTATTNFLTLTSDASFKAFFRAYPDSLTPMLQRILPLPEGSKIESVEVMNPELSSKESKGVEGGKTFILDLLVKLKTITNDEVVEETAIVEMQTSTPSKRLFPKYGQPSGLFANRLCRADLRRGITTPASSLCRLRQIDLNLGHICYDKLYAIFGVL